MSEINLTGVAYFGNETIFPSGGEFAGEEEFFKYEWWQYFIIPWVAGEFLI